MMKYLAEKIMSYSTPRILPPPGKFYKYMNKAAANIYLNALESFQFFPPLRLQTIQEKRILFLIQKARKSSEFYRGHLARVETIEDFYRLAPMSKEQMKREFEKGSVVSKNLLDYRLPQRTSGSTGVPFRFFMDTNMAPRRIALYRLVLQWMGKRPDDTIILLMPFSHPFLEDEYVFFQCGSPEEIELRFEAICKLFENKSIILQARTSYLIRLAQLIEKQEKQFLFRSVISYTEELTGAIRTYLEGVFRAPIFNYYGCNEVSVIGHECDVRDGFHVNTGWTYCEIIDERGRHSSPQKEGNIIVTSLDNEVMPFIRYETGDRGYWMAGPCPCGRTFPRIKIQGRKGGIFLLPDGKTGYAWQLLWPITSCIQKIEKYRAIRRSPTEFEIQIVPTSQFSQSDEDEITSKLRTYLGPEVQLMLRIVSNIPLTPGRKQQPFINLYSDSSS